MNYTILRQLSRDIWWKKEVSELTCRFFDFLHNVANTHEFDQDGKDVGFLPKASRINACWQDISKAPHVIESRNKHNCFGPDYCLTRDEEFLLFHEILKDLNEMSNEYVITLYEILPLRQMCQGDFHPKTAIMLKYTRIKK